MWEAADLQWWWRRPRTTDELALPVWFDEVGPVAAAGLTAWDDVWQADIFAVPSIDRGKRRLGCDDGGRRGASRRALRTLVRQVDSSLVISPSRVASP